MLVKPECPRILGRTPEAFREQTRSARQLDPSAWFRSVTAMASAACSSSGRYASPCISIAVVATFRAVPIPFEINPPTPGMRLAAFEPARLTALTSCSCCFWASERA